ncbi:MAG: NAD(P)-dependent oxidoreductase [Pseudomarimonas sp.]
MESTKTPSRFALLTLRLPPALQGQLETALLAQGFSLLHPTDAASFKTAIAEAEIALLQGNANSDCLGHAGLRWIHCGHAGLEGYLPVVLVNGTATITSAAGRSAPALAEHALFLMMCLAYDHAGLTVFRRWRQWQAPPVAKRRALHGRTLGIIGLGHTGSALAAYANALGMRVLVWRRQPADPASVERVYCAADGDHLVDMLGQCEFVAITCSLNAATHHLFGAAELAALPRGAFLINVGRGAVIDEAAMIAALRSGQLGGAGLDVVEWEPLAANSPLWRMPNVQISPHRTPRLADREQRHLAMIETNLARYLAGLPLLNALGAEDAITPQQAPPRSFYQRALSLVWRCLYRLMHRS